MQLQEYQDRTLYTTWDLSYSLLKDDDPLAAQTLKMLAYFDNQDLWFELLHAGLGNESPSWLREIATEHMDFENVMGTLVDYCLAEAHLTRGSYSMHNCVHDWALSQLNGTVSDRLYCYAVDCVVANIDKDDWNSLGQLRYARLARHGSRCAHSHFQDVLKPDELSTTHISDIVWLAEMLAKQLQWSAAEQMYVRALAGKEKALGPDHTSTLQAVNNLGVLYADQGKLEEAEQMSLRALVGYRKSLGSEHQRTLSASGLYASIAKLKDGRQGDTSRDPDP